MVRRFDYLDGLRLVENKLTPLMLRPCSLKNCIGDAVGQHKLQLELSNEAANSCHLSRFTINPNVSDTRIAEVVDPRLSPRPLCSCSGSPPLDLMPTARVCDGKATAICRRIGSQLAAKVVPHRRRCTEAGLLGNRIDRMRRAFK